MPQATVALLWRSIRMKPPRVRSFAYGLEGDGVVQPHRAVTHLVQIEATRGQLGLTVDVHLVLDRHHPRIDRAGTDLQR